MGLGFFRSRFGSRSLNGPSGFHGSRELRAAFRREVKFSFHFRSTVPSIRVCWFRWGLCCQAVCLLLDWCQRLTALESLASASGFPLGLHCVRFRHRFKLSFQSGKLLRTFLQANLEPPDLFPDSLQLHSEINSAPGRSPCRSCLHSTLHLPLCEHQF